MFVDDANDGYDGYCPQNWDFDAPNPKIIFDNVMANNGATCDGFGTIVSNYRGRLGTAVKAQAGSPLI